MLRDESEVRGEHSSVYDGFISYSHAADGLLAPRLQSALQRFAKPWWKRRAVRIFRDESSLSANPHLWSSITEALDTSGWFVLLLSPDAASSEWVNREIEYWVEHNDPKRILPVVTDGEFGWENGGVIGDALPDVLVGVFTEEPRWVDLRWAKGEEQLDLQDPRFADAVADIASTVRGIPKDDLASEEVRQHRRTVRTAWSAGGLVAILAIAAVGFGIQSARNAADARQQTQLARAASLASASRAEVSADPELAVLLGVQSLREAETYEGSRALGQALQEHRVLLTLEPSDGVGLEGGGGIVPAVAPDGELVAILERSLGTADRLQLFRIADLVAEQRGGDEAVPVWTVDAGNGLGFWIAAFSVDGSEVIAFEGPVAESNARGRIDALADQVPGSRRLVAFDVASGEERRSVDAPRCANPKPMATARPIDVTQPLLLEVPPEVDGACSAPTSLGSLLLLDLVTGDVTTVTESYPIVGLGTGFPSLSRDGTRVAYAQGAPGSGLPPGAVIELETAEVLLELAGGESMLSPDGRLVLTGSHEGQPLELWDVDRRVKLREFQGNMNTADFSPDGTIVYGAVADGSIALFDASSGEEILRLTGQGGESFGIVMDEDQTILGSVSVDGSFWLWDIGSRVPGSAGRPDLSLPSGRFLGLGQAGDRIAATWTPDQSVLQGPKRVAFFDSDTSEMQRDLPGFLVAISPDARMAAIQTWSEEPTTLSADDVEDMRCVRCDDFPAGAGDYWKVGTLELIDLETFTVIDEMPGFCTWWTGPGVELLGVDCGQTGPRPEWMLNGMFSPDGSLLAVGGASGVAAVWDLRAGQIVWQGTKEEGTPDFPLSFVSLAFSPDGEFLFVSALYESAAVVLDTSTWEEVARIPLEDSGFFTVAEFTPDGARLLLGDNLHQVVVIDTSTWRRLEPLRGQRGNYLPTLDISPSGRLVATGGFDGTVWVWNLENRSVVRKWTVSAGRLIFAVEFVDDDSLLIIPDTGSQTWTGVFLPLDVESQVRDALTRLTRSFSPEECSTYDIVPCPTLEDLRAG